MTFEISDTKNTEKNKIKKRKEINDKGNNSETEGWAGVPTTVNTTLNSLCLNYLQQLMVNGPEHSRDFSVLSEQRKECLLGQSCESPALQKVSPDCPHLEETNTKAV